MDEPQDKGYTVKDRRYLHLSEEEKARIREEESQKGAEQEAGAAPGGESETDVPFPEITFASFVFSLGTSAFIHLGVIPDPETGETRKNLPLAKQTIDLLGLLREKTRNNLTPEEDNLFDPLLYDLRMLYIKATS